MMARKSGEVGRGFAWRGCAAGGALGALALAAVFLVAGSRGGATELAAFPPEKAAAMGRIEALARRDTSALARAKTDVPLGLLRLDGVAKAVSLAEDDRQIAKARKEVLAAQQWMKQVHLIKAAQAPAKKKQAHEHEKEGIKARQDWAKANPEDDAKVAELKKELWPQAKKPADAVESPAMQLHRAVESHFGAVFRKAAVPASLHGRETMLVNGAQATTGTKQGKQMMLAMRGEAKAAVQLKSFAKTLLSSQRQAAAELKDLEQHFG